MTLRWRRIGAAWEGAKDWLAVCLPGSGARVRARESEERLTLALDAAGMAIWEMDAETGAMWWSAQAARLFGGEDEAGALRTRLAHVVQRIHPEDRTAFQAAIADAVSNSGEIHRIQARVVRPDGSVRWLEARGQSWLDSEGRLRGLRGSLVDVTELKDVEENLRRNLEELRVVTAVAERAAEAGDEGALLACSTGVIRDSFFPETCGFLILDEEARVLRHARSFHARRGSDRLEPLRLGSGVAGEVAVSGEGRRIEACRGEAGGATVGGTRSEICVPLKVGARVLGVLVAASGRESAFSERDEGLLTVVASHVANALERLRSEERLRRSSDMYRAYFTASPLAVFVADTRGRYLEVNGAATALTGYTRDELLHMAIPELVASDEESAGLGDRLARLLALGAGRSEIRIRRKDGEVLHCLVHAATIGEDQLLGFLLDITDRRTAEEKVRESEERFRGLSEASLEAIMVHDRGKIVDVNHALCELGGYAWHELVGRDAFIFIAPEDRETVYRALLTDYHKPYEITGVRRDGSRLPLEVRARSFPFKGQNLRVVALRDISERKRAEEFRESLIRDLEAKNAELERFLHTVSHDLKAPLITIQGFARYLLTDVQDGRSDRFAADAARIGDAAGTMQRLLDHLVELSHTGREVGPPEPVSIEEVAAEALRQVEGRRAGSGVSVELGAGLPVVFGDRASLVQVFQNLLDNAVKFSAGGREPGVTVEAGPAGAGMATIVVKDNGVGIDPTHHQRVFGLFEKLDPHAEGTGVGLAVVKRIVETHGGTAEVASRGKDCGTEIRISLPTPPQEGTRQASPGLREAAERQTG